MSDEELWAIEEGLWIRGRSHYERWYSNDAVAAFPGVGIMAGAGFVSTLPETGGYETVEMTQTTLSRPAPSVAVLAYVGTGSRDSETVRCLCTSTYCERDGEWRLVQHQQTPQ